MTSPLDNDGRAEPLTAPVGGEQASGNDKPLDDEQFLIELVEEPGLNERQECQPATSDSHDPPELPAFLRKPWMPALAPHDLQTGGYHPEKVYGVTRRFSLATVMLMMAGASILLAAMNAFNVSPFISGTLIVLCFATALGQMFLFGGNDPRRASIVVGAAFCTLGPLLLGIVLGVRIFGSRDRAMEILISLLSGLPLGAMAGYVAGCVVAGVLLMMDLTESKLERWRKAREPDDDPLAATQIAGDEPTSHGAAAMTFWRTALAAALLSTAGCGGPTPAPPPARLSQANFDGIQNGMSLVQVEQSLGSWSNLERNIVVKVNGADRRADQYQWKRKGKEIDVNFIADKVVSKSAQGL